MLAGDIVSASPKVVIYVVTRWGAVARPDLGNFRFLDVRAARQLFDVSVFLEGHTDLVTLWARGRFFLLRHARPIVEIAGENLGLPIREMLGVVGDEPWMGANLQIAAFPTVQTRAILYLARQFRKAGIPFLVVSPPVGMDSQSGLLTDAQARRHQEVQVAMDEWLTRMAEEEGFLYLEQALFGSYGAAAFQDPVHLEPSGQVRFTMALGPYVNGLLAAAP
jgi:hypothetical protein